MSVIPIDVEFKKSQEFEINKSTAKKHKLVITDRLLDLAISVVE